MITLIIIGGFLVWLLGFCIAWVMLRAWVLNRWDDKPIAFLFSVLWPVLLILTPLAMVFIGLTDGLEAIARRLRRED